MYVHEKAEYLATKAAELDGWRAQLERDRVEMSKQHGKQADGAAHNRSHRVHDQIMHDENGVHYFARARQNVAAAVMIVHSIPEP